MRSDIASSTRPSSPDGGVDPERGAPLVDVHSHYAVPGVAVLAPRRVPTAFQETWRTVQRRAGDLDAMRREMDTLELRRRVLSAPPAMVTPPGRRTTRDTLARINDHLVEVVTREPERFSGFATIDAFNGDAGAREVQRLAGSGLPGIVVDCASGVARLDDPVARPTLEAAWAAGLVVFVHPVSPARLSSELAGVGRAGMSLARSTAVGASLVAVLASELLDSLRGLRLVFPMLAAGALLAVAASGVAERIRPDVSPERRWHVHLDTMGYEPAAIAFATSMVGPDHVLAGSDWPVAARTLHRSAVEHALREASLTAADVARVLGGNALRLLGAEGVPGFG